VFFSYILVNKDDQNWTSEYQFVYSIATISRVSHEMYSGGGRCTSVCEQLAHNLHKRRRLEPCHVKAALRPARPKAITQPTSRPRCATISTPLA